LYAWASSVRGGTVLKPPLLVSLTLSFILDSLVGGKHRVKCNAPESHIGELFRTDSKGADTFVVLAGWETLKGRSTSEARWFSLRLEEAQVPWLFKEGKGSSWSSTSSELLASMVAVQVFTSAAVGKSRHSGEVVLTGGTDNKSNEALSVKRSSTKLPVMLILMQLAVLLSSRALKLELRWRPRDENSEADDLTNDRFGAFSSHLRIPISWEDVEKTLLLKLLKVQEDYLKVLSLAKIRSMVVFGSTVPMLKRAKKADKTAW
jgi:hypothetical protein